MPLTQFIQDNRAKLDQAITRVRDFVPRTASCDCPLSRTDHVHEGARLDDAERRLWILNDEGLYQWARAEGVKI